MNAIMAYDHIKEMLEIKGKRQQDYADALGIERVIVTNLFQGRRALKDTEVLQTARFLNKPVEWVLNKDYQGEIPVIGVVHMSGSVELLVNPEDLQEYLHNLRSIPGVRFLPCPPSESYPNMFIVELDAMKKKAFYCAGIIAKDFEQYFDELCFIKTKDDKYMVRIIRRGSAVGLYDLVNDLHEVLKDKEIDWCARVRFTYHA